jgi:hypothetical protein
MRSGSMVKAVFLFSTSLYGQLSFHLLKKLV